MQARPKALDSIRATDGLAGLQTDLPSSNLVNRIGRAPYIPSLDTLSTTLRFLEQGRGLVAGMEESKEKIRDAMRRVESLKKEFQLAEMVRKQISERRLYWKSRLEQAGLSTQLKRLNKQVYYYSEQVKEYKELLKDHKKAERKALDMLSKMPAYREFMRKNSMLASLFRLPGDDAGAAGMGLPAGLQTRVQVNSLLQGLSTGGGPQAGQQIAQGMREAQGRLADLKSRIEKAGLSSSDDEMPEGFRPNNQKTKSFLKRLEAGANMQSQRSRGYFPVTSDLGLSLGYRLNDRSTVGLGASYKLGWGRNIRQIRITHEGVGLRSFVDWKLPSPFGGSRKGAGSFWLSGGYEMNYRSAFRKIEELKNMDAWQQSGLIGISKTVSVKARFFKKTKLMLLWDFLSYGEEPRGQPVVFRIGYGLR